jgi:hypothetical protein
MLDKPSYGYLFWGGMGMNAFALNRWPWLAWVDRTGGHLCGIGRGFIGKEENRHACEPTQHKAGQA